MTTLNLKQGTFLSKHEGLAGWVDGPGLPGFMRKLVTLGSLGWWPEPSELPWSSGASV